jgi:uncharacterized membrane protein YgcG
MSDPGQDCWEEIKKRVDAKMSVHSTNKGIPIITIISIISEVLSLVIAAINHYHQSNTHSNSVASASHSSGGHSSGGSTHSGGGSTHVQP